MKRTTEIEELPQDEKRYSDYIVYVDESGDHGLATIDPAYPVFVLSLCVFRKDAYVRRTVPMMQSFKFRHFGHDIVVLREHDIRKEVRGFRFADRSAKDRFLLELTEIIETDDFRLISCVIDKTRLKQTSTTADNPYHLALGFCLELLFELLAENGQLGATTALVVECRGKKEDGELVAEFRRICAGANRWSRRLPFDVVFADKRSNSSGLQLADLVARPIGLSVLRPRESNRAFDVLRRKFFRDRSGARCEGLSEWRGLRIFPAPDSEKPR